MNFFSDQVYDDWINQFLTMEHEEVFKYCCKMSDNAFHTFWEFQKRSTLYYNRNGTPKSNPKIPEGAKISPTTEENRQKITELCLEDKELRVLMNKLDLHRIPVKGLVSMMAYSLNELW